MKLNPTEVTSVIKEQIDRFQPSVSFFEAGEVLQVGDGIARVTGLPGAMSGELLEFENGVMGIAQNLEEGSIGVILLGEDHSVKEGAMVRRTGTVPHVPVGDVMLGRVVDALGRPLDKRGGIHANRRRPVELEAPGVMARAPVDTPLQTGIKAIDSMVPIGRGQRQLIIGDRQIGKTAIAVDTIINQRDSGVCCVYVAIGQKASTVSGIVKTLNDYRAMEYTTIVMATASDPPALQYLAPYAGCAIAEEWMALGKDVLIVYDDLSKHAVAYRTLSLLLRRPPGREAYPGDIFYLHSRLLERAGRLNEASGGGSLTALPIIETLAGNMSGYIATNVISITDGQIYLETESFNAGIRPAINPGLSVSRVGGAAQTKAMKKVSGPIRTLLAQYRELAKFAQFGSDLDKTTRAQLRHGERMVEILKQEQYHPFTVEHEVISLLAATENLLDDVRVEDIGDFEGDLLHYIDRNHSSVLEELHATQDLSDELRTRIVALIQTYKEQYYL